MRLLNYYGARYVDRHMSVLAEPSANVSTRRDVLPSGTSSDQVEELPVRAQSARHINALQNSDFRIIIILRSSYEPRTSKRDVMCECVILKMKNENHYCYQKVSVDSYFRFIVVTRYSNGIPYSHYVFAETLNR